MRIFKYKHPKRCGHHLTLFCLEKHSLLQLKSIFAVLPESRFSMPAREFHPDVVSLISSQDHIPFGRSFSYKKDKKPVHRYQNKRKIIFRYSFDENLCTGFEIQMPQCLYLSRFCTQTVRCEAFAVISAYRRSQCFIGYSVVVLV